MELFLLYLWMKLDIFRVIWGMSALLGLGSLLIWAAILDADGVWDKCKHLWARGAWLVVTCFFLFIVVPSSNQMAGLVVGGVALKAAESPEAQKLLSLLRQRASDYLDEQLKDK